MPGKSSKHDDMKNIDAESFLPPEILQWEQEGRRTKAGNLSPAEHYLNCLDNGSDPKFAVQLVAQAIGASRPGIGVTDSVFIQDQNRWGRSILDRHNGDARAVERLRKALAKNGYHLKSDDHYIPTVSRFFGDPEAIVNHTQGMGDLRRNLEARGTEFHGEVNCEARDKGKRIPVKHQLNPTIVERIRQRKIKENPDLARKDQRELREQIIDQHGSKAKFV